MSADGGLERVPGEAAVTEGAAAGGHRQKLPEARLRRWGELEVGAFSEQRQNLDQLVVGVVVELDDGSKAAGKAGIGCHERFHRRGISGDDDHEIVSPVLHLLDQGVHGFLAVLVAGQAVGLIDEQHAACRRGDNFARLDRGLAQVPRHQLRAVNLDQLALREQLESFVDPADQPRHGRLARAGVAREDEMAGDRGAFHPRVRPQPLDPQDRDLTVDLALDPLQANQGVELGQ